MAKPKRNALGGVSLPVRREKSGVPIRELLYLAAAVGSLAACLAYDGHERAVLVGLGAALIFSSLLWSSRRKRLGGDRAEP